jgi:hypothetical protein
MTNASQILVGKPGGLKRISMKLSGREGVDWIFFVQDRDGWRTVVMSVRSIRVHKWREMS